MEGGGQEVEGPTTKLSIFFQLQLYAMRQTRTVIIDTSYTAKAFLAPTNDNYTKFNEVTLISVQPEITTLVGTSLFFIIFFSITIIAAIICLFCMSKKDHWETKMNKNKPLLCSVALLSAAVILYNLILSILAKCWYHKTYATHPLYTSDTNLTEGPLNILLSVNLVCSGAIIIISFVCCVECCQSHHASVISRCIMTRHRLPPWYIILSFTIFCPIISVMAHSPYIIIGYLNDGHHASSVFIYYTLVIGIGIAICWAGFHPHEFLKSTRTRPNPQPPTPMHRENS